MTEMANLIKWLSEQWWVPVNSYGPCVGFTLLRCGRRKVELWYAPADYATPEHTHDNSSGEFTILYSKNRRIYRRIGTKTDAYIANTPEAWGRFLSVRAGTPHAFSKGDSAMIWLCFETWKPGVMVTSVADDFRLT